MVGDIERSRKPTPQTTSENGSSQGSLVSPPITINISQTVEQRQEIKLDFAAKGDLAVAKRHLRHSIELAKDNPTFLDNVEKFLPRASRIYRRTKDSELGGLLVKASQMLEDAP